MKVQMQSITLSDENLTVNRFAVDGPIVMERPLEAFTNDVVVNLNVANEVACMRLHVAIVNALRAIGVEIKDDEIQPTPASDTRG